MLKVVRKYHYKVLSDAAALGGQVFRPAPDFDLVEHKSNAGIGARCFGSQEQPAEPPVLKRVLRELYKRVHPDIFHDVPHAREANEQSFKLLQEYLASARKGGEASQTAGLPYKFRFFLYRQDVPSETELEDQDGELKKVELILPPPARLDAGAAEGALPRSTQKALGRLLTACGLSADFSGGAEQEGPLSLRHFVPQAAELARQRQLSQRGPRHDISALRTALRLGRQVTVAFPPSAQAQGAVYKAELLRQLASALDRVQHLDVKGLRFVLGQEYGVDSEGQLWLDSRDNALFWSGYQSLGARCIQSAGPPLPLPTAFSVGRFPLTGVPLAMLRLTTGVCLIPTMAPGSSLWPLLLAYLSATDFSECRDRHVMLKRIQLLEASVAAALGLSMVYSSAVLRVKPEYYRFLERMAAEAADTGALADGTYRGVPLRIVADAADGEGSQDAFSTDTDHGFLSVPVSAPAQDVYKYIQAHGQQVQQALTRRQREHDKSEDLRRALERRLRLRRLNRDPALSHDRFCTACMRLLRAADVLMPLMEGLEVRISEVNVVAPDGAHIDVAWDCDI